jgi:signal transduction histidine kinase
VQPAQIELRPVIDEVVADLGHLGVERVRVTAPAGLRAWADPDRLGQVLTNLLRNALQYSAPSAPVEVDAGTDLGSAWITVADHGPGISPERLPSLFERFSDHELDAEAGLGVGLWIVRELLRAMRGAVTVDRNAAGGTTFRVVLPAGPGVRLAERR